MRRARFFAGLAAFLYDEVGHCAAVDGHGFELVEALAAVGHGKVEEFLGEFNEAGVFGNEVGFALEGDDSGEVAFVFESTQPSAATRSSRLAATA